MRFTDILFIIVILVLVGYGVFFYMKSQLAKDINELEKRKDRVMEVSIPDQLFTLKNMELSGQTKRQYENLVANWQTITNYQFTEIEAALVGAEQFADQMNIVKSKKVLEDAREMLDETEAQVDDLSEALKELLSVDEQNREEIEALLERYNTARKSVMNHSFDYGPAIETLEKNLQYLELNFTKYNELTASGDHLEAKEMLAVIESDLSSLEEILEKIPAMYNQIKNKYEDSIEDLRDGYQKMVESHFKFGDINIPEEIDAVQELLDEAKIKIKNADLVEARTQMDKSEREINSLYELMESEIASKEYVNKNINQLGTQLDQVSENNRYAGIEVDRISQSYILHNNELDQVSELTEQIRNEYQRFNDIVGQINDHTVIYTKVESDIKKIKKRVEEIDEKQNKLVQGLSDMNHKEKETKQNLDLYEMDLRNYKRRIEKHHLPGLNDNYYTLFFKVTDQIEELAKLLNKVRIDMFEIETLESRLVENLNKLEELTEQTIDNAMLTEYMIQHSNRFRYDYPEVDDAIREAQYLFHQDFRYGDSLAVIEKALRRVDQDAPTQVRRMYHKEKQSRIY
ncbi:septation ring formation regulator EzrA [Globicatella sanguinis]|uniref:septation ring formation regulator EzrA n=1 Tax=Globicatella sanguinis TaxID=13076 RepID=UPI000826ACA3|nr:septation ring formation regulator EzrA [Globicatella sanguinis]MDK7630293.1 septation ring formation regulator EzrA [Globicatella sanguinis]WIK67223.1 septation ring formation regulator EzrA [Globicatella sanguinis]WKT56628.1 septation ring formation regulator EzrA [Globicatella sanguinis]